MGPQWAHDRRPAVPAEPAGFQFRAVFGSFQCCQLMPNLLVTSTTQLLFFAHGYGSCEVKGSGGRKWASELSAPVLRQCPGAGFALGVEEAGRIVQG